MTTEPSWAENFSGRARVIDGDTIVIGSVNVRLSGIDAPETKQECVSYGSSYSCGQLATLKLVGLIGNRPIRCESEGYDRYGRTLATCWVDDVNVNRWMIVFGWAVAYLRYSQRYAEDAIAAQNARVGIWSGRFDLPEDWRRMRAGRSHTSSD